MAAAEGVVPGQPVDQNRRFPRELGKGFEQHLLVAAQHAVRGRHGLGQFGRARREEKFGDGVGAHRCVNRVDGGGRRVQQVIERRHAMRRTHLAWSVDRYDFDVRRHHRCDGPGEHIVVADENESRREQIDRMTQFAEVARSQRIGRRNRRIRNAGPHCAQRQLQMLEIVAGENRDRPLDGKIAGQQSLPDSASALQRLRVAHADPFAVDTAACRQPALGMRLRTAREPVGHAPRMFAERLGRAQIPRVAAPLRMHRRSTDRRGAIARRRAGGIRLFRLGMQSLSPVTRRL